MIAKIRKCQHDSSRFFFVAQSFTASVTGTSLIGGPSFAIRSKEFKVFSFNRFCTLVLVKKNSFHIGCLNGNHSTYLCKSNHVGTDYSPWWITTKLWYDFPLFQAIAVFFQNLSKTTPFLKAFNRVSNNTLELTSSSFNISIAIFSKGFENLSKQIVGKVW